MDSNEPDGIQLEFDVHNGYLSAETKTFYSGTNAISTEQSIKLSSLLENTPSLKTFDMLYIKFEPSNDDAFRRIVMACSTLKSLYLRCSNMGRVTALADLLRSPRSQITCLLFEGSPHRQIEEMITNVICDTSSIANIQSSNHTLERVFLRVRDLPPQMKDCLELNKNINKDMVIHKKIARYYFIGEFSMSPFVNMSLSLLPRVLSMIEGGGLAAVFRLVTSIPELCNVSNRETIHQNDRTRHFDNSCRKFGTVKW